MADKYIMSLFTSMEDEVTADIVRRVKKTGRFTETAELQAKSMHELGYSPAKIQAEVMKMLRADKKLQMEIAENTKAYKQEVKRIIEETVEAAKTSGNNLVAEAGTMAWNDDMQMWKEQGVDLKKPNTLNQLIVAFQKQTINELKNLTRTMGFKGALVGTIGVLNMYQREMDLALLKVATGTFSYDQAVNDCVHRLAQSGLRSIDYASGRAYQIDTAVRMSVRTGMSQLAGRVTEMNLEQTGQDLVITSQHIGSRPEHAPWQNKVFSYSGKSKKYPDFRTGTGYGTACGLKGVNCTHNFYPFWEGASIIPEDIKEPEPVIVGGKKYDYYQATQKQRSMERDIRALKREIEAQKAIGGDTRELQKKLKNQTAEYQKFSKDVGIRAKENRLRVTAGSFDLKKTKAWKKYGELSSAKSNNIGQQVFYDESRGYKIELEGYSQDISRSLSKAAREVAVKGSGSGNEYMALVDMDNGKIVCRHTDNLPNQVGGKVLYDYLKEHSTNKYAFIHNHNRATELSLGDIELMANNEQIISIAAVRNDGIISIVKSNGKHTSDYLPLRYEKELTEYRLKKYGKKIPMEKYAEYSLDSELFLRNLAIEEFSDGGMITYE